MLLLFLVWNENILDHIRRLKTNHFQMNCLTFLYVNPETLEKNSNEIASRFWLLILFRPYSFSQLFFYLIF